MDVDIKGMAPLLQVYDMPATLAFYRDILGFAIVESDGPPETADWIWMNWHGVHLMFNTAYERAHRPSMPDARRIAAHNDTSLYFVCPNVDALYEYLSAKAVKTDPPTVTKYGYKALYVKDPDNYLLVFHWPVQ